MKTKKQAVLILGLWVWFQAVGWIAEIAVSQNSSSQQFENSVQNVSKNEFQPVRNSSPPVVEIVQEEYYESFLKPLSFPSRKILIFLSSEKRAEASRPLQVVSLPPDVLVRIGESSIEKPLRNRLSFPLKSYLLLLEKTQARLPNNEIGIGSRPIQVMPAGKKLKVTVILRSSENIQPNEDVESYAVVYLDKKKVGVTEQKLLSQQKILELETTYEKHLLELVIFIQDPNRKVWRRLRNIEQPDARYFRPDPSQNEIYLQITYFPERKVKKYEFEGSFYKK